MQWRNKSEMMASDSFGVGKAGGGRLFSRDVPRRHLYGGDIWISTGMMRRKQPCGKMRRRQQVEKPRGNKWTDEARGGRLDCRGIAAMVRCRCGQGDFWGLLNVYSLISLATLTSCTFKLHFNICLCSDSQ